MEDPNQKQRYEMVDRFYGGHWKEKESFTVHHFEKMGMKCSTLYNIISGWRQNCPMKRLPKGGPKRTKNDTYCIVKFALLKPGMSYCRMSK
jgi:hypothetical protein